ncbi:MAG: response regulator [Thermoanaerobaculia bacterium]|nr:response regulator [Thermoanaerobaculia bacterium]
MARTILLADDSVTIQKVVELTFMDEDCEVVAVSKGDEAVARLDEVAPDLVIADVHMPGASGFDVCRAAKERDPALPVLLLVGTFEPFEEEDAEAAGADGHLKKPFDSQELLRQVEDLLEAGETTKVQPPEEVGEIESPEEGVEVQPPEDLAEVEAEPLEEGEEPMTEVEAEPLETDGAAEETEETSSLEVEPSPWEDMEEEEPVDVERPEGLVTTETFGAGAEDEDLRVEPPPPLESEEPTEPEDLSAAVTGEEGEAETPEARPETAPPPEAPPEERELAAEPEPMPTGGTRDELSDAEVDRIARRVVELLGDRMLRDIAWEVVPDLAEVVIKDRIRELERQVE